MKDKLEYYLDEIDGGERLVMRAFGFPNALQGIEDCIEKGYRVDGYFNAFCSSATMFSEFRIPFIKNIKRPVPAVFHMPDGEVGGFEDLASLDNTKKNRDFIRSLAKNYLIDIPFEKFRKVDTMVNEFEDRYHNT